MEPKFDLGLIVMTKKAAMTLHPPDILDATLRHWTGDWGEACDEDRAANEFALRHGLRLLSVYTDKFRTKFWIITEADRSVTTVLLPDDY